ncbi:hypothetical protein LguiB_026069 [Lonicera macranthoides]
MDEAIADLKIRIKVLNDQMQYMATIVHDFAAIANFFADKEKENNTLQAQLQAIEKSEYSKYATIVEKLLPSMFYPEEHQPSPDVQDSMTGFLNPNSINLWDEPPKRKLPPGHYPLLPYVDPFDAAKKVIQPPPTAKKARGLLIKEPAPQVSKTSPTLQPDAYSKPPEVSDIIQAVHLLPPPQNHPVPPHFLHYDPDPADPDTPIFQGHYDPCFPPKPKTHLSRESANPHPAVRLEQSKNGSECAVYWSKLHFEDPSKMAEALSELEQILRSKHQTLKSSEESLREQLEKAKKKEAAFIVTVAKREQEISELKEKLTSQEADVLMTCKGMAVREFTIGAGAGGGIAWLVRKRETPVSFLHIPIIGSALWEY